MAVLQKEKGERKVSKQRDQKQMFASFEGHPTNACARMRPHTPPQRRLLAGRSRAEHLCRRRLLRKSNEARRGLETGDVTACRADAGATLSKVCTSR